MVSTIRASAEMFGEVIPGEVIREQLGESGDDVCVQILSRRRHQQNIVIPAVPEPLIVWIVSGEAMVEEREMGGEWKRNRVVKGDFFLTTATAPTEMRWKASGAAPFQVMHVYIGLTLLQLAIRDVYGKPMRTFALREVSGEKDALLSSLLAHIEQELKEREKPSRRYMQGLAQSLTVHVVRSYETASRQGAGLRGGLQAYKLRRIVDAMTDNLAEPFRLNHYAAIAELSDYHFSRVFKQTTTLSPSTYFTHLRMERAKTLLQDSALSILDIGAAVGYASPSHLSMLFRGATGLTPGEYRSMHRTVKRE